MSVTYDEISDLSEEEQERYHQYVQKSLRRQWSKIKDKTEKEIDNEKRRNG